MACICVCKCVCMFACVCYDMAKPHHSLLWQNKLRAVQFGAEGPKLVGPKAPLMPSAGTSWKSRPQGGFSASIYIYIYIPMSIFQILYQYENAKKDISKISPINTKGS